MAALAVALPVGRGSASFPPKTQSSWTDRADSAGRSRFYKMWEAGSISPTRRNADWRRMHFTAMLENYKRHTLPTYDVYLRAAALCAALLHELAATPQPYGSCPPTQLTEDTLLSHELSDPLAFARSVASWEPCQPTFTTKTSETTVLRMDYNINLGDTTGVQTRGKKATKKAAKSAQQAKWTDLSEGEGNGGTAGDGGDDAGAGGGDQGGTGGGGDDGDNNNGGGGGEDEWDLPGAGKKTKKKNKKKQEEEEEEQKKQEEEQKRQDEQQAATNSLSWADEANDAVAAGDDWTTGFATKKKGKKGKKGTDDLPPPAPEAPASAAFQDISLDDAAPKLDFSFGGSESKKDAGGFGAWGKTWDFGSLDNGTKVDDKASKKNSDKTNDSAGLGDNNPWSSKSKKKTTTSYGFDFGNLDGEKELGFDGDVGDAGDAGDVSGTKPTDDAWGFSSVNKKDKKKKDTKVDDHASIVDPGSKDDDLLGTWANPTKKDKKKKGFAWDEEPEPPPPPPVEPEPALAEDSWGFSTSKSKKKGKKGIAEEPAPDAHAASADVAIDNTFDLGFGGKKDKKAKKSMFSDFNDDDDLLAVSTPAAAPDTTAADGDDWMSGAWGAKKKVKKDKKTGIEDLSASIDLSATADPKHEPAAVGIAAKGKKDKKGKKGTILEEEPVPPPPAPEAADDLWSSFGTKDKKGKKGKVTSPEPSIPDPVFEVEIEPEPEPFHDLYADTTGWDKLSPKERKKKEREAKKNGLLLPGEDPPVPEPIAEPEPEPASEVKEESSWGFGGWGTSTKDKKSKAKSFMDFDDDPPPPPPAPEPVVKDEPVDGWGIPSKDKKKTKKKGFLEPIEEPPAPPPAPEPEAQDESWGTFGFSTKDKKKKDKDVKKGGFLDTIDEPVVAESQDSKFKDHDAFDTWGTAKSKKDTKKKSFLDFDDPVSPEPAPIVEVKEDDGFYGLSAKDKKKKEKEAAKKKTFLDFDDPVPPEPAPIVEVDEDDGFYGLSAKDKKKKEKEAAKKKNFLDFDDDPVPPEPAPIVEAKMEDSFYGLSVKDKKKEKEAAKKKGVTAAIIEPEPEILVEPEPVVEKNEDTWGTWGTTSKDKKKVGKDVKKKGVTEVEDFKPVEKTKKLAEDDTWGDSWATKDTKAGKKSKTRDDLPPPAPSPPAQGLTPEPDPIEMLDDDLAGDTWAGLTTVKSKASSTKKSTTSTTTSKTLTGKEKLKKTKDVDRFADAAPAAEEWPEETPASVTKSMWGSGATTTTTKLTKREKEAKAKKDAEEQVRKEEEERLAREAEEAEAEMARLAAEEAAAAKSSKKKVVKTSKTDAKVSKTKDADELLDLLDATPAPKPVKGSKLTKTVSNKEETADDKADDDYFGTWGNTSTAKKTTGKKDSASKREIGKQDWANQDDTLEAFARDSGFDFDKPTSSSSKVAKAMTPSTTKAKLSSSVADRIKALEVKREETGKKSKTADSGLTKDLPPLDDAPSPKEEKKPIDKATGLKTKTASSSKTTKTSKKDASPIAEEKKSKDSVPGSFPGAYDDEFDYNPPTEPTSPEKPKSKAKAVEKKITKSRTATPKASVAVNLDLSEEDPVPTKVSTPPPEDKGAKKERAKVERSATASWGFWGAAPPSKKPTKEKPKDEEEMPPPPPTKKEKSPTGLARSKSARTPKERDQEDRREVEKLSKSSGSDKDTKLKKTERPKATRGPSFSNFMFGGPPPSAMPRSKTTTRRPSSAASSQPSSRRQSVDGFTSPNLEDEPPITDKAAKLMGMKSARVERRASVKKNPSAVPDPYPIDDDDMVMIHTKDNPHFGNGVAGFEKPKSKFSRSKKEIKSHTKNYSQDDDVVMVESPTQADPLVTSGPDDMAFVDHPPGLKRSNTAPKKSGGIFGSFFGGSRPAVERSRSHTLTDAEDLPIRTKDKSKRRSRAVDGDELTTDAPGETDADVEARRAERRAKRDARDQAEEADRAEREQRRKERRDREKADLEARQRKAREREQREQEEEDRRREEKRARRAAKEARIAQEEAGIQAETDRRREERKRLRAQLEVEQSGAREVSKDDRRKSYYAEEDERRKRKDDRNPRDKDRGRSGRKTTSALVEEYHESRSGSGRGTAPPANKTSSWINSQTDEPPDLPPLEGTVLDPSGQRPRAAHEDGEHKRSGRHRDRYAGMTDAEIEDHRAGRKSSRRGEVISASGGSDERDRKERRRRRDRDPADDRGYGYDEAPVKTWDGRPALGVRNDSKRRSFLGGLF